MPPGTRRTSLAFCALVALSAAEFDAPARTLYTTAFAKLQSDAAAAMPSFAALVGLHPDDPLASYHLKRLLNGGKGIQIKLD